MLEGASRRKATIEHGAESSERIIYTALRDAHGAYRGVLETVVPLPEND